MADTARQLADAQERAQVQLQADEAKVSVANTMSDATVFWTERMQNAMTQAPKDAAGFTQNTLTDFDAWTQEKLDAQTSEPAKRLLEDNLRRMRLHMHAEAFNFEVKQRNKALVDDFSTGLDADRRAVAADPSLFADAQARRVAAAQALSLPPDVRDQLARSARQDLAFDAANALVDRNPAAFLERAGLRTAKGAKGKAGGQAEDAAARVAADPILSSLDPDKLRRVTDRASMIVSQQEAAAAADAERRARQAQVAADQRERAAVTSFQILSGRAMSGVKTDPVADKPLLDAIAGTPFAAEYQRQLQAVGARTAVAMLPIGTQQAQIDSLIAQRNTAGTNTGLEEEIKVRKDLLAASDRAYRESPLRATQQYGIQNLAPVDTSTMPALVQTIGARIPQAQVAGRQIGTAASPLLPEEAEQVQRQFAALPADQKGQWIAALAGKVPPDQMQALSKQLNDRDRPLALAMSTGAGMTDAGNTVASLVLKGASKLADTKTSGVSERGDAVRQQSRATMLKYLDGDKPESASLTGQARQDILDTALYIDAGFDKSDPERAVRLALGGTPTDHNGKRIPLPAGVDIDQFRTRLRQYPVADLAKQAPDGYVVQAGARPMGVPEFLANLPQAVLEPAGYGRYFVRSGAGVALNTQGKPIVIEAR